MGCVERVDARWFVTMGEIGNLFGGDTFCFSSGTGGLVGDLASLFGELDCFRSGDLFEMVCFQFSNYRCVYIYI